MPEHDVAIWIIICSRRAQAAITSVGAGATVGSTPHAVSFLKTYADKAARLGDEFAGIDFDAPPDTSKLIPKQQLMLWCERAKAEVAGMSDGALRSLATGRINTSKAMEAVELLEAIEDAAYALILA